MSSEFGMQILKLVMTSLRGRRPWQSIVALSILFLAACTDYVSQIEDRYGEWNDGQVPIDPLTVVMGEMTDSRDGQTYKTVTIGSQTWMAENLNYAYTGIPYNYDGISSDSTSWCFGNKASYCSRFGRLYTWAAAMDSASTWSSNGKGCGYGKKCSLTYPVRGACPSGWHLPTKTEFETLFILVGGSSDVGYKLKSRSGWNDNGYGMDGYSFSALPAGFRGYDGNCFNMGSYAYFWSSTEDNSGNAYRMYLNYKDDFANLNDFVKYYGFSVRCVKD